MPLPLLPFFSSEYIMENKGPWLLIGGFGVVAGVIFSQMVVADSYAAVLYYAVMTSILLLVIYRVYTIMRESPVIEEVGVDE